jgi:parvulin-like peptidyl-prolyl isomerase
VATRPGSILVKRLLLLIVVLALTVAACSDSAGQVIATIDGETDVTLGDVTELFESDTLPVDGTLRDAVFAVIAREILVNGLMDDFGVELDEDAVDELYDNLVTQIEDNGSTPEETLGIANAGFEMVRFNAEIGVIRQQATDEITSSPEFVDEYFSDPATYTTVCARHILVETEAEANDVLTRLGDGEDFADLAAEVSNDSPTGDLGCSVASRYVTEFADATMTAELGEYTGPVETDFGFHVLVVDERTAPTTEEIQADPSAFLTNDDLGAIWGEWLNGQLGAAEVDLDPEYGTWSDVGIVPPESDDS